MTPNRPTKTPPTKDDALLHVLQDMIANQTSILNKVVKLEESVLKNEKILENHVTQTNTKLADISKGFPGGDADAHRRYHETQIALVEEKRKLRIAISEKTISGIIWSAIVFVGIAAWTAIKQHIVGS